MAERTRSRLSRTTGAGRPTMLNPGRPRPRWASICTSGASSPSCAQLRTCATPTRPPSNAAAGSVRHGRERLLQLLQALFERPDARLELGNTLARAFQHLGLHVELAARSQVKPACSALQHPAEISLEIGAHAAECGRQAGDEAPRHFIHRHSFHSHPSSIPCSETARPARPTVYIGAMGPGPGPPGPEFPTARHGTDSAHRLRRPSRLTEGYAHPRMTGIRDSGSDR